ncbi:Uncharacterised protein [Mycobacteroides abscessus subsp. abscessus]|nr:Uncharacterised protein [Mycobacteroides abscessus subsp. abscessus]
MHCGNTTFERDAVGARDHRAGPEGEGHAESDAQAGADEQPKLRRAPVIQCSGVQHEKQRNPHGHSRDEEARET